MFTLLIFNMLPFLFMFILFYGVHRYDKFCSENSEYKKYEKLNIYHYSDLSPSKLKQNIIKNIETNEANVDDFVKEYKRILIILAIYFVCWVLYIVAIALMIYFLFKFRLSNLDSNQIGSILGSIIMSLLETYWFLLTPIFELFNMKILVSLGYKTWGLLNNFYKYIAQYIFQNIIKRLVLTILSFIPLYVYIKFLHILLSSYNTINARVLTFLFLLTLIIYQFIILKFIAKLLTKIRETKLLKKIRFLRSAPLNCKKLYAIISNYTYLCLVFIYLISLTDKLSDHPIAIATGILFLIDTFVQNEHNIKHSD